MHDKAPLARNPLAPSASFLWAPWLISRRHIPSCAIGPPPPHPHHPATTPPPFPVISSVTEPGPTSEVRGVWSVCGDRKGGKECRGGDKATPIRIWADGRVRAKMCPPQPPHRPPPTPPHHYHNHQEASVRGQHLGPDQRKRNGVSSSLTSSKGC